ncbi:P-loop containing nucleoside triphosphate hydrolase protein [Phakopsora pachyrhizi]|uniref:P-loop containing nucleoside triphosphate hydrolase protein n=1 Tax=Phakopsora pachyrhizi TaxID=170000 RepID=A0AAV0BR71_PHAPC|nr:P-loop containing nucleoside triphosphate hydrolase protein [Phakopsora pachyrhizi]
MVDNANWRSGPSYDLFARPNSSSNTNSTYLGNNAHYQSIDPIYRQAAGRGRPNRPHSSKPKAKSKNFPLIDPPMRTLQYIQNLWKGSGEPHPSWFENPKGVLNNYCQVSLQNSPVYRAEQATFPGISQPVFRVTVQPDLNLSILGVGDDPNKKVAERLSAISACIQLGLSDAFSNSKDTKVAHRLPDGKSLTLEQAKTFMEFYCKKFKFGKPTVTFDNLKRGNDNLKKSKVRESWFATLSVEGSRVGDGQAKSKKEASNEAYMSSVVYLAECDGALWTEFLNTAKDVIPAGAVPEVVFRLSNEMEFDLRKIVNSSRSSELYQRAKAMLESDRREGKDSLQAANDQNCISRRSNARTFSNENRLEKKSEELTNRLAEYQTETSSAVSALREQRASLPVTAHKSLVLSALATNPVTILMAATGSGKTTQVPQLILDEATMRGQGARCNIICTQPRRIAAISVAQRVANERKESLGQSVGYQVRFEAKPPAPDGSILFCTTGVFLRRLQSDMESADGSFLDPITHIVVDEVHERDIDTDLLLFCLRRVLNDRKAKGKKEIKVLLMSATVDPTLFESYFADPRNGKPAPVISVPGRSFPVEKHYLEKINGELQKLSLNPSRGGWVWREEKVQKYLKRELQEQLILDPQTGKICRDTDDLEMPYALISLVIAWVLSKSLDGHVLVFLPGWEEIKAVQNILTNTQDYPLLDLDFNDSSKFEVHILHSAIPVVDQQRVFSPPSPRIRRVILSTNIAETSVTIPDVVFVVDTGKIKEKRFDPERHLSSLVTAWVGTSNLNQRAGRAGRHRPGDYYGLLSSRRYEALQIHSTVEMKRTDLSNLVMHVKALNFPNMEAEDVLAQTIEPPESERVSAAMFHLQKIGALDRYKDLTALGRVLLQLPVEAQIGKLLLLGSFFQCLEPALNLAAILTNRDPFLSPPAAKAEADRIKSSWAPSGFRSDPLACLAAFTTWSSIQDGRDGYKSQRFATENFLSKTTLAQISQVKSHLLSALRRAGVLAVSGGGLEQESRYNIHTGIPAQLNKNSDSLPLLSALIAVAVAPNFAVRKSTRIFLTEKDRTCFINSSSVNSHKKEIAAGEDLPRQNERQLFAFGEKSLSLPRPGEKGQGQMTLRSTTKLDPFGYMILGARRLEPCSRGLMCDNWLPITGKEGALNDVMRLKDVLDASLLRVFDGLQAQIYAKRDPAAYLNRLLKEKMAQRNKNSTRSSFNRREEEEADDDCLPDIDEVEDELEDNKAIRFTTLTIEEIKDLEKLTEGVVSLLNQYAEEWLAADQSRGPSRPDSRTTNRYAGGRTVDYGNAPGGFNQSRPGSSLAQRAIAAAPGLSDKTGSKPNSTLNLPSASSMRAWQMPNSSRGSSYSSRSNNPSVNPSRSSENWR